MNNKNLPSCQARGWLRKMVFLLSPESERGTSEKNILSRKNVADISAPDLSNLCFKLPNRIRPNKLLLSRFGIHLLYCVNHISIMFI